MLRWYVALPILSLLVCCAGCGGDSATTRKRSPSPTTKSDTGADADTKVADSGDAADATPEGDQTGSKPEKGAWGTLKGRFVIEGDPPKRQKINVTKDVDFCGKFDLQDEQLVVGEDGGIAGVMVWLRDSNVDVHPDYAADAEATIEFDNTKCRFQPHVIAMRVGQTLRIKNDDPIAHNSQILFSQNPQFNENIPIGGQKDIKPTKEERLPVSIACSIHPWMKARLLLRNSPYMAVSADDGTFEIVNLPTGIDLELQFYHAKSGYISEVTLDGKVTKWPRGKVTKVIAEGDNDMGEIRIAPAVFE